LRNQLALWTINAFAGGDRWTGEIGLITKTAVTALPSEVNTWVHLAGVYDPPNDRIWLYVNGTRKGDGTITTPWQPTGGVRIGRGMEDGVPSEFWPGSVDDVRIYRTALDDNAVSALYCSYPLSNCSPG
jgi:hypothetical protein